MPLAFAPLRHPAFRLLWWANLAANIGLWVQNTGAGWMMTGLDPSPFMVSMVQAASMLPVFLLALPAGAAADIIDRRHYLIGAQGWVLTVATMLALLTWAGWLGPWGLLFFTFCIGMGNALNFPAWAATTPELVPREDLVQAIALNGIGFNLSRAVGPAIGGFVIGLAGTEAAFALNAFCFLVLLLSLLFWKREKPDNPLPPEHFLGAMRAGLRFVAASPAMRATILRANVFFFFTAAVWGLLPLVVRQRLGLGPEAYGMMLGVMGIGAVGTGFALPYLRARLPTRGGMVLAFSLVSSVALALLGVSVHWLPAAVALLLFGAGWLAAASTLQAAAQFATPAWVRARAIGIYQLCFFGAMTLGAVLWGWAGTHFGVAPALLLAGAIGAVCAVAVRGWGLDTPPAREAPAVAMPRPEAPAAELAPLLAGDTGRVLEFVRYTVRPEDRPAFLLAMREVRSVRLRSGALAWRLLEDVARPERWVEFWAVESWTEHLREVGRLDAVDQAVLARAAAFQAGEGPPEAARYLTVQS
ncbi:MFS transporter [Neoroseomonas soli]|uniref:MFS transporter n=1 Tax=Neoroseomonas soli TaxID=1081025 RepID=A0A9X9X442_9PROT|nr:MFS transporter [Neoroseomonas soli]MBR0674171.1 MFS transporter [Neoroseomonas soli]